MPREHGVDSVLLGQTVRRQGWFPGDVHIDSFPACFIDLGRLSAMLARVQGRITTRRLDRVSPLAVPVLLEIGKEAVYGEAVDELLDGAARALIDEACGLYAAEPGLELDVRHADALPAMMLDADQITQALQNVLGNAVEALRGLPEGARRSLSVATRLEEGRARIDIEDNGSDTITIELGAHKIRHQNGGGDEINVGGLSGLLADNQVAGWLYSSSYPVDLSTPPTSPLPGRVH